MLPTYRVIVSPEAFDDLDSIFEYIKQHSPQNAAATIDRLWKAAQSLATFPHRFKVYRHSRRPELVIRAMSVRPFAIYYRVVEESSTVRVLTVRHGARKPPRFGK